MHELNLERRLSEALLERAEAPVETFDAEAIAIAAIAGAQLRTRRIRWLLATAAATVTVATSSAVLGSMLFREVPASPTPTAVQTPRTREAASFDLPFEYTIPAGSALSRTPMTVAEGPPGWPITAPGRVIEFTDGGPGGDRGVIVALPGEGPYGISPWCFGPVREGDATLDEILQDLRWDGAPAIPSERTSTTFDGRPAVSVRMPSATCPTLHPWERRSAPGNSGVLTLVQVDGTTVAIVTWATGMTHLADWLPAAQEFTDSIHFVGRQEDSP